jgi:hypothetical protein
MRTLILALLALWAGAAMAQATTPSYTVTSGSITYADLSTYTDVKLGDDELSAPISPSGFSFKYFQGTHTEFMIGSNGYILIGTNSSTISITPDHGGMPGGNAISALWTDIKADKMSTAHEIGYYWSAPVLTVEWCNIYCAQTGPSMLTPAVRMQIVVNTATRVIECRWGTPTLFQSYGALQSLADAVAISDQPGIVAHEVIDGSDSGYINSDGSVKTYPTGRYVRFTPNGGPQITTTSPLPNGTNGQSYSQQFAASGGAAPYTWSATGLPSGWSMSTSGLLSAPGASVTTGNYAFDITATDSLNAQDIENFTVKINPQTLAITTTSPLPPGTAGQAYSQQFAGTGGVTPYAWGATGLPGGWSMSAGGLLSASAGSVVAGTFNFNVNVTDSYTPVNTASGPFSVTIVPSGSPLTITTTSPLASGTAGVAYSKQFNASGGTSPYTWGATGLPSGWSISTGGLLSAAAGNVVAGTFNFTVSVSDSAAGSDSDPFTITINAPPPLNIATTSLVAGTVGTPYAAAITAVNGSGSYSWTLVLGTLPPGVTGIPGSSTPAIGLSGVPTAAGSYSFTVQVQDGLGAVDTQAYTVVISIPGGSLGNGGGGGGGCSTAEGPALWLLLAAFAGVIAWRSRRFA